MKKYIAIATLYTLFFLVESTAKLFGKNGISDDLVQHGKDFRNRSAFL